MKNFLTKGLVVILCGALLTSCSMSKTGKGALIGAGSGAAIGAGVGALIGKDGTSTAVGAVGTAVGATAGAIIGRWIKAAELEALENAKVETITDANNLQAIKVTFDSGILFATNSSTLSAESRQLSEFANTVKDLPDTDFTIRVILITRYYEVNERVSLEQAKAVSSYLQSCGIATSVHRSWSGL